MRDIKQIIIHCADTPDDHKYRFTIKDVDLWHRDRKWFRKMEARQAFNPHLSSVGYHFVICRDGTVESGRGIDEVGSHAQGFNTTSIGICLIGQSRFTDDQWSSLYNLLNVLKVEFPDAVVMGHYQVAVNGKTCPNFDVKEFVSEGFVPDADHIFTV